MNIQSILREVIPPNNVANRMEFNNEPIIDALSIEERSLLEDSLIEKIYHEDDLLIAETLLYLTSVRSLPALYNYLDRVTDPMKIMAITGIIFRLNGDKAMIYQALEAFAKVEADKGKYFKYALIASFSYLSKFSREEIKNVIRKYLSNEDYLVAYNAKKAIAE